METTDTTGSTVLTDAVRNVQNIFNTYLSLDPSEVSRVTVLAEQMIDGDAGLYSRKCMKGHLTASALVVTDDDQVLLIHHNSLNRWLQPGGHLDPGEDPQSGARRELVEETGLPDTAITLHPIHSTASLQAISAASHMRAQILPIDIDSHLIPVNSAKGEGQHLHHDFQYIYQLHGQNHALKIQEEEVSKIKWVDIKDLLDGQYGVRLKRVAQKIQKAKAAL